MLFVGKRAIGVDRDVIYKVCACAADVEKVIDIVPVKSERHICCNFGQVKRVRDYAIYVDGSSCRKGSAYIYARWFLKR